MPSSLRRRLAFFPTLLLALACDRRLEPYVEPADEPAPVERPVHVPGLESPAPRTRMPMGPPGAPVANADSGADGAPIRGTVVAGEGVETSGEGVLFVIARSSGGGPPLAVKRLSVGPFPLAFEIGPADVMMKRRPFSGPISITARIDRDGNPLTRDPDDPAAELAAPVEPGTTDVVLRLERSNPG